MPLSKVVVQIDPDESADSILERLMRLQPKPGHVHRLCGLVYPTDRLNPRISIVIVGEVGDDLRFEYHGGGVFHFYGHGAPSADQIFPVPEGHLKAWKTYLATLNQSVRENVLELLKPNDAGSGLRMPLNPTGSTKLVDNGKNAG